MICALRMAREAGVRLSIDRGEVKVKFKPEEVDTAILSALKPHKESLRAHLNWIQGLRYYSPVVTPLGPGVVWEIYPWLQRIGVMVDGCPMPYFFYYEEITKPGSINGGSINVGHP